MRRNSGLPSPTVVSALSRLREAARRGDGRRRPRARRSASSRPDASAGFSATARARAGGGSSSAHTRPSPWKRPGTRPGSWWRASRSATGTPWPSGRPRVPPAGRPGARRSKPSPPSTWRSTRSETSGSAPWKEDERKLRVEVLPVWGSRPAAEIRRTDVRELLERIVTERGGVCANRTRTLISRVFSFGMEKERVESNPVHGVKRLYAEKPRERVLSEDEILALWPLFDRLQPAVAAAWRLILLTAQRPGEVLSMRWRDLERDSRGWWWNLPAELTKTNRAHRVPLSPQALAVVEALRPLTGPRNGCSPPARTASGSRGCRTARRGSGSGPAWNTSPRTTSAGRPQRGSAAPGSAPTP